MTKKVALDAGHGKFTAGKRTPADEREWTFNNQVLVSCQAELKRYNISVLRLDDPSGRTDVPLRTRTTKANNWKADILVSIHHNANNGRWGTWGGTETYHYGSGSAASRRLAHLVQPKLVKAMGLRDRGVKTMNLHMIRESHMPAILTEAGFMDSTIDIVAMRNSQLMHKQGVAIAEGIVEFFGMKVIGGSQTATIPKPAPPVRIPVPTKGIGGIVILTDGLSLRAEPSLNGKLIRVLKAGGSYNAYNKKGMWYDLGNGQWVSEGAAKKHVQFTPIATAPKPLPAPIAPPVAPPAPVVVEPVRTPGTFRVVTGTFPDAKTVALAKDKLQTKYGVTVYEQATTLEYNPNYRLATGTFGFKESAEEFMKQLKAEFGWTLYLKDETNQ